MRNFKSRLAIAQGGRKIQGDSRGDQKKAEQDRMEIAAMMREKLSQAQQIEETGRNLFAKAADNPVEEYDVDGFVIERDFEMEASEMNAAADFDQTDR